MALFKAFIKNLHGKESQQQATTPCQEKDNSSGSINRDGF